VTQAHGLLKRAAGAQAAHDVMQADGQHMKGSRRVGSTKGEARGQHKRGSRHVGSTAGVQA